MYRIFFLAYIDRFHAYTSHRLYEEEQMQLARYCKMFMAIPGLNEKVQCTIEYGFLGLSRLASFVRAQRPLCISRSSPQKLGHMYNECRADDLAVMHKHPHHYIPSIGGYPDDTFPLYNPANV